MTWVLAFKCQSLKAVTDELILAFKHTTLDCNMELSLTTESFFGNAGDRIIT